jgi:hypothetical protein
MRYISSSALAIAVTAGALFSQTVSFDARRDFLAGYSTSRVVAADFNSDGKPDLVSTRTGPSFGPVLYFLPGNGDGTFGKTRVLRAPYSAQVLITDVVEADFNGDGRADLAICAEDSSASVFPLLGNGDGTFQSAPIIPGILCSSLAAADLNGDGQTDLVAVSYNNEAAVIFGAGNGRFGAPIAITLVSPPASVLVADFNRDGNPDLLFGVTGGFELLTGNGSGSFNPGPLEPLFGNTIPTLSAAADVNGDGNLDVVIGEPTSVFSILGNGDGTFQPAMAQSGGEPYVTAFVPMDVNGDGLSDLLVLVDIQQTLGNAQGMQVWRALPDGNFAAERIYGVTTNPRAITLADLNLDGQRDAAIPSGESYAVSILLGTADGSFSDTPEVFGTSQTSSVAIAMTDLNNDGRPDVVNLYNSSGNQGPISRFVAYVGDGEGNFSPPFSASTGYNSSGIGIGDFNRDGFADLAVINRTVDNFTGGALAIFFGLGDGTFRTPFYVSVGNTPNSIIVADFNGDGIPDLAIAQMNTEGAAGSVSVLLGKGNGAFQQAVYYVAGSHPSQVVAADVNVDGRLDLVAIAGRSVAVLGGNGDGTFQPPIYTGFVSSGGLMHEFVGDFNSDGHPDLVTTSQDSGLRVKFLAGNGDGTFQQPVEIGGFSYAGLGFVGGGDFNGDGKLDIGAILSSAFVVIAGNGDGSFQQPVLFGTSAYPVAFATGDLNGDGKTDVVVDNEAGFSVILNTTP